MPDDEATDVRITLTLEEIVGSLIVRAWLDDFIDWAYTDPYQDQVPISS